MPLGEPDAAAVRTTGEGHLVRPHTASEPPTGATTLSGNLSDLPRSDVEDSSQTNPAYATVDSMTSPGGTRHSRYESGLPDFRLPPLVEVALGLMFEPLSIDSMTLAQLYLEWQEDYPNIEEHLAIPPSSSTPGLILERVGVPHLRFWFMNESGRLIQIQRDRLVVNWRKEREYDAYPRYGSLRVELERRLGEFSDFLGTRKHGNLRPNASEITYVNHIPLSGEVQSLSDIVTLLRPAPSDVGTPVETNLTVRFDVSNELDREPANLVVNAQRSPNVDPPLAVLQLSCVSPVTDIPDAFKALDRARYQVVRSFQQITTPKMHAEWGFEG